MLDSAIWREMSARRAPYISGSSIADCRSLSRSASGRRAMASSMVLGVLSGGLGASCSVSPGSAVRRPSAAARMS